MSDERLLEDELVSAYIDGEATPAEIAAVEASDALLARAEQLRAVRDAVAEPVVPLPANRRDDLIGAALGVAGAEAVARAGARVVSLRRPQRRMLAMAAAVVLVAAVVGAGLIAGRSGDESADFTADAGAPAADQAGTEVAAAAAPAEEAAMDELDTAEMDMDEMALAEEAPMDELDTAEAAAPMAEEEAMADDSLEAAMAAAAEVEAAPDEAAAPTTTAAAATTTDARRDAEETLPSGADADDAGPGDGAPVAPVPDLGVLETLEELFESIGAGWSAALEDGAVADPGACSSAVNERALELGAETLHPFVASVGIEDPVAADGRFARRRDGTAFIVHASPPDCEVGVHEVPDS